MNCETLRTGEFPLAGQHGSGWRRVQSSNPHTFHYLHEQPQIAVSAGIYPKHQRPDHVLAASDKGPQQNPSCWVGRQQQTLKFARVHSAHWDPLFARSPLLFFWTLTAKCWKGPSYLPMQARPASGTEVGAENRRTNGGYLCPPLATHRNPGKRWTPRQARAFPWAEFIRMPRDIVFHRRSPQEQWMATQQQQQLHALTCTH